MGLIPNRRSHSAPFAWRSRTISVISASANRVTRAASRHDCPIRSKITLRIPVSGITSGTAVAGAAAGAAVRAAIARSTSSRTMRPSGPVGVIAAISMP